MSREARKPTESRSHHHPPLSRLGREGEQSRVDCPPNAVRVAECSPRGAGPWWWVNLPFIVLIRLYQVTLSPLMAGQCRFVPTCSRYAVEAFGHHNPARAAWLIGRRVIRCHPWGGSGFDPVPPANDHRG